MAHKIEFFSLPTREVSRIRPSEGVDGLRSRLDVHGETLTEIELKHVRSQDIFDQIDQLIDTNLVDLLGAEIAGLDGNRTDPQVGYINADDIADAVDALDRLTEAIQLDPDEEDDEDYELAPLFELRNRVEEVAEELGMVMDDDFESLANELLETLKEAMDNSTEVITVVSPIADEEV